LNNSYGHPQYKLQRNHYPKTKLSAIPTDNFSIQLSNDSKEQFAGD